MITQQALDGTDLPSALKYPLSVYTKTPGFQQWAQSLAYGRAWEVCARVKIQVVPHSEADRLSYLQLLWAFMELTASVKFCFSEQGQQWHKGPCITLPALDPEAPRVDLLLTEWPLKAHQVLQNYARLPLGLSLVTSRAPQPLCLSQSPAV